MKKNSNFSVLSYRDQESLVNSWLKTRLNKIVLKVMKENNIDSWIIACNEYNEDPVLRYVLPYCFYNGRRTMILIFILKNNKIKRLSITRPGIGLDKYYNNVWINQKDSSWFVDKEKRENQFECLNRVLKENHVKKIGLNFSNDIPFADGLSKTMYEKIMLHFDNDLKEKVISAQNLVIGYLETRLTPEVKMYKEVVSITRKIIAEAFSNKTITPGKTTNCDVKYYMMQHVIDLGLQPWFDFEVSIIRSNSENWIEKETVIREGDILHCDIGLKYLGLCSDIQEIAYVLKKGEKEAPEYLKSLFLINNRFQDIVTSNFIEGKTGNEILINSIKEAKNEGIKPLLYSHPIGFHGHGCGMVIGLFDKQEGLNDLRGNYCLHNNTTYSLELSTINQCPEFSNYPIMFATECDIIFTNNKVQYISGRQKDFHIIN